MRIAQKLYDSGYITYMRTDSTYINPDFESDIKQYIYDNFGEKYYTKKELKQVKGAQEAHEAIRPTDLQVILPDTFNSEEHNIYNLIVKKTIQSYMSPAVYNNLIVTFNHNYSNQYGHFISKQKQLNFKGYLAYSSISDNKQINLDILKETTFLLLNACAKYIPSKPPNYYNESAIVKQLEKNGIGRPSTYANIIHTLYSRNYTEVVTIPSTDTIIDIIELDNHFIQHRKITHSFPLQKNKIKLTQLGKQVLTYLSEHFSNIISTEFTSQVELDLDKISLGDIEWTHVVSKVYSMFSTIVDNLSVNAKINTIDIPYKRSIITIKSGNYGYYCTHIKKNYNISNYLKWTHTNIDDITNSDLDIIFKYPYKVGSHNKKPIYIHLGPYGYYMKYNHTNYKIHQNPPHTKTYCESILRI